MADLSEHRESCFSTTKNISTITIAMATNLGRVVSHHEGFQPIKSRDPLITWSFKTTWQAKNNISTTRVTVTAKLGRILTYIDGLLPTESQDPFVTWSCKVMWQTKTISLLVSKATKLSRMLLPIRSHVS